jgi:hypothetical protein
MYLDQGLTAGIELRDLCYQLDPEGSLPVIHRVSRTDSLSRGSELIKSSGRGINQSRTGEHG